MKWAEVVETVEFGVVSAEHDQRVMDCERSTSCSGCCRRESAPAVVIRRDKIRSDFCRNEWSLFNKSLVTRLVWTSCDKSGGAEASGFHRAGSGRRTAEWRRPRNLAPWRSRTAPFYSMGPRRSCTRIRETSKLEAIDKVHEDADRKCLREVNLLLNSKSYHCIRGSLRNIYTMIYLVMTSSTNASSL